MNETIWELIITAVVIVAAVTLWLGAFDLAGSILAEIKAFIAR